MESPERFLGDRPIIRLTPELAQKAQNITQGLTDPRDQAKALFYHVRDQVQYNPYSPFFLPEHYRPDRTLERGYGYCVQKSALLVGLARSQGLPARLLFADIVNHRCPQKLRDFLGTNLFTHHAYVEWFVTDRWIKVAPIFDQPLCDKLEILPVDFDGEHDAVLHRLNRHGQLHTEYVRHYGIRDDVPLEEILAAWDRTYSKERVALWKELCLAEGLC